MEAATRSRRWRRRLVGAAAAVVALSATGIAFLALTSDYDFRGLAHFGRPGDPRPPAWSKPCWRQDPKYRVRYVLPCARVRGRVVYVQRSDPDGDGDAHAVVVAGSRPVVVKFRSLAGGHGRPRRALPGLGQRIEVAGTVSGGQYGVRVVDVGRR
jgi:hypothetical protein